MWLQILARVKYEFWFAIACVDMQISHAFNEFPSSAWYLISHVE